MCETKPRKKRRKMLIWKRKKGKKEEKDKNKQRKDKHVQAYTTMLTKYSLRKKRIIKRKKGPMAHY
jgi:hypothetical protein